MDVTLPERWSFDVDQTDSVPEAMVNADGSRVALSGPPPHSPQGRKADGLVRGRFAPRLLGLSFAASLPTESALQAAEPRAAGLHRMPPTGHRNRRQMDPSCFAVLRALVLGLPVVTTRRYAWSVDASIRVKGVWSISGSEDVSWSRLPGSWRWRGCGRAGGRYSASGSAESPSGSCLLRAPGDVGLGGGAAACGCRELGHVTPPADTRAEGRRAGLVAAGGRSRRRAGECGLRAGAERAIGAGGACCSCATRRSVVSLA
jgi:hypothetical protein